MSVLNQSGEEQVQVECPLCMEPLEVDDLHFYPCTCGYQICRFCWNRIREGETGLCPACRKAYPENPADFTPLSQEQVAAIKTEKKAREQKRRNKTLESRRALANVRVVQNNLVFVVGLPVRLADPEILKRQEYFGKYGKIHKVVINQSTTYAGSQGPSASAYVTYVSPADALRAIQGVNNVSLDGRVLKGSLGTTKYCANFMKNLPCPKPDCMYLHDLGDPKASFTKEEMHAGLHQVYERKLHNQLLASQRDKPTDDKSNTPGIPSTSTEKVSSKDGNQANFIPTTVVTSSHINIVNSSKSNKKESVNGSSSLRSGSSGSSGSSSSSSSSSGSGSALGRDGWPSLGSSPPVDSPATHNTHKSQETDSPESYSPTQQQQQSTQHQAQTKHKENTENGKTRNKDITNGPTKKSKNDNKNKKNSNSNSNIDNDTEETQPNTTQPTSVFESDTQNYLSNELDELESDRHSLLENHELLDNSEHSLLEDDTHGLLDADLMLQRHRDLSMMPMKPVNGYGLIDRDIMSYLSNDRQISQMNQALMDQKEMLLRDRSQSEMVMRQNEMLARQHNVMVEPKLYMPTSSIGLDTTSELLGANYHQNSHMLPPFGMRVDNSMTNSMSASSLNVNPLGSGSMAGGFMFSNQQMMQQQMQPGLVNGFDSPQSVNEGRYMAENMDKFFTDFHKAQQMRLLLGRGEERRFEHQHQHQHHQQQQHQHHQHQHQHQYPHNMLSAERLEMEHKRMNVRGVGGGAGADGARAAGDGDDDLDFDPFKETQKALAEMMESEMQTNVSSGDSMERLRRARLPPPGFGLAGVYAPRHQHHPGFNSTSATFADWTQMDPAIVSTSVNFGKGVQQQQQQPQQTLSQQQQELFARFNQLGLQNGVKQQWPNQKLQWSGVPYNNIPLPPGFAPAKSAQHPAECIDAK